MVPSLLPDLDAIRPRLGLPRHLRDDGLRVDGAADSGRSGHPPGGLLGLAGTLQSRAGDRGRNGRIVGRLGDQLLGRLQAGTAAGDPLRTIRAALPIEDRCRRRMVRHVRSRRHLRGASASRHPPPDLDSRRPFPDAVRPFLADDDPRRWPFQRRPGLVRHARPRRSTIADEGSGRPPQRAGIEVDVADRLRRRNRPALRIDDVDAETCARRSPRR